MSNFEDAGKWFNEAGDGCQEIERKAFYKGLSLLALGLAELHSLIKESVKKNPG